MTASRRELILQSLLTAVAPAALAGGRVFRSRKAAIDSNECPALILEAGDAEPVETSTCRLDWTMDVLLLAFARATSLAGGGQIASDTAADALLTQAYGLIMADRTVGGLAMRLTPGVMRTDLERAAPDSCLLLQVFRVQYRTVVDDLTAG